MIGMARIVKFELLQRGTRVRTDGVSRPGVASTGRFIKKHSPRVLQSFPASSFLFFSFLSFFLSFFLCRDCPQRFLRIFEGSLCCNETCRACSLQCRNAIQLEEIVNGGGAGRGRGRGETTKSADT